MKRFALAALIFTSLTACSTKPVPSYSPPYVPPEVQMGITAPTSEMPVGKPTATMPGLPR